jgi:hypothetical protein
LCYQARANPFSQKDELSQSPIRELSEGTEGFSHIENPLQTQDGQDSIPYSGYGTRSIGGANPAGIFAHGHIAHVVNAIFDMPMLSPQAE